LALLGPFAQPVHPPRSADYSTIASDSGGQRQIKNSIIYNKQVRAWTSGLERAAWETRGQHEQRLCSVLLIPSALPARASLRTCACVFDPQTLKARAEKRKKLEEFNQKHQDEIKQAEAGPGKPAAGPAAVPAPAPKDAASGAGGEQTGGGAGGDAAGGGAPAPQAAPAAVPPSAAE